MQSWIEFSKFPDFNNLERWTQRDLEITELAKLGASATSFAQLAMAEFFRGNWDMGLARAQEACRLEFPNAFEGFGTGMLFRQLAYRNDHRDALRLLDQNRSKLPRLGEPSPVGSWAMLVLIEEGLFVLGERLLAAEFYPLLSHAAESGTIMLIAVSRFMHTGAAIAATAKQQWELADHHFQIATRQASEFPHLLEQAEIDRFYGQMLLERNARGDREKARGLVTEAIASYERFEMPRHVQLARSLLN